jgi:hypothetical protein
VLPTTHAGARRRPERLVTAHVLEIARRIGPTPTVGDLARAVELVRADLDDVAQLLRDARDEQLAEVTAGSYRHPNGFAKIVLYDGGPRRTSVRLHVWPRAGAHAVFEGVPRRDTAPHSHRWAFASTLIAGTGLVIDDFSRDEVGELHDRFVFEPGVTSELRRDGRDSRGQERLVGRTSHVRRDSVDDIYACDPFRVHTVAPVDERLTATLVLQGPEERRHAEVFRRADAPPDAGRAELEEPIVATLISDVLMEVEATVDGAGPQPWHSPRWTLSGC